MKARKKLNPAAQRRIYKANLPQSRYCRASCIDVVTTTVGDKVRVVAELLPSTALPNVLGVVEGTVAETSGYLRTLSRIASELKLRFVYHDKQVVS